MISKLRYINYGDYGMDLYSNAIIVSKKLVKDKPEAVKGLVRAINKGLEDALKDIRTRRSPPSPSASH